MLGSSITKISIVIPVKNGASTIESCLEAIFRQTLIEQTEVIIIDSGSTDGTWNKKIPGNGCIRFLRRNLTMVQPVTTGLSLSNGEFVVMTIRMVAADNKWLENMLRHFEDTTVAGVCGGQMVPHRKDYNPHQWFRPQNTPKHGKYHLQKKNMIA